MNDLFENSRINLKPSIDWNKWLSTIFKQGRCECIRCQDNSYDESSYDQFHSFVINGQDMSRRFAVTGMDDLKGKLKNAWISYYDLSDEPQLEGEEGDTSSVEETEKEAFISQLEDGQVELEKVKAFTLFATHYFELTELPNLYDKATNVHLDAIEHGDKIVFLHQLKLGAANQSYGLQVAKLAGVPNDVIKAAKNKLQQLETKRVESTENSHDPQGDLFNQPAQTSAVEQYLDLIDPDELTPKQAQEKLYQLVALLKQ